MNHPQLEEIRLFVHSNLKFIPFMICHDGYAGDVKKAAVTPHCPRWFNPQDAIA